jgi:hypothetical protein
MAAQDERRSYVALRRCRIRGVDYDVGAAVLLNDREAAWLAQQGGIQVDGIVRVHQTIPPALEAKPLPLRNRVRTGCRGCGWR